MLGLFDYLFDFFVGKDLLGFASCYSWDRFVKLIQIENLYEDS
jgi:hypothetical protein